MKPSKSLGIKVLIKNFTNKESKLEKLLDLFADIEEDQRDDQDLEDPKKLN